MWKRAASNWFENRIILDFCQYGKLYRKRTCLATNSNFKPKPLCDPKICHACLNGKTHCITAQRGPGKNRCHKTDRCSLDEHHAYPEELCQDIYKHITKELVWEIL